MSYKQFWTCPSCGAKFKSTSEYLNKGKLRMIDKLKKATFLLGYFVGVVIVLCLLAVVVAITVAGIMRLF